MQTMLYLSSNNQDVEQSLRIETADPLDIVPEVGPMLGTVLPNMAHVVNVPADGMCFYHCLVACRDLEAWMAQHDRRGQAASHEMRQRDEANDREARASLVGYIRSVGHSLRQVQLLMFPLAVTLKFSCCLESHEGDMEAADRLTKDGPDGYPGEAEFRYAADMLGGRLLLQCGPCCRSHGRGEPLFMLRHVLVSDAIGHLGEHYVVCRSWLTPGVVEVDIPQESLPLTPPPRLTTFPITCAFNEKEDAVTPRASQPTVHPQQTTFQGCLQRFASCGQTLASAAAEVYGAEHTTSVLGEIQDLRLRVSRAVSDGHREISPYLQKLACAALLVFSRRMTDFHLRDHVLLFYLMEGGTGIRAHNGTLYCYNKGAWSMFSGLISDALLGRSKDFLLEVEGLFRALLPKTERKEADIIAAVLQVLCDRHHACEEDFLRTLRQKRVHGMVTGRRSVLPEPYVDVRIDPDFDRDEDRFAQPALETPTCRGHCTSPTHWSGFVAQRSSFRC